MHADARARRRRMWLALAALVVVAFVFARWTGSVAAGRWRDSLDERLADAGAGANAVVLDTERDHLMAIRAFTFTTGLAEALGTLDVEAIERLLGPADANLGVPMVDVLDDSGRVVFAFRGETQVPPIYRDRADLGIVQRSLRGEPDEYGERFSTLAVTDEGALIASAGPVTLDGRVVGALLVMTPLADVLTAATNQSGGLLTVYSGDGGVPLSTTAPVKPRTLPASLDRVLPAEQLPVASAYDLPGGAAREQLGALVVRHETVAWLGVAAEDQSGAVARQVSLVTALAILLCSALAGGVTLLWTRGTVPRRFDLAWDGEERREAIPAPAGALSPPAAEPISGYTEPAGRHR